MQNMIRFVNVVGKERRRAPSFMMVLIGVGQYAYRREDGVYVVPIWCLKN